jgi:outer membrane lipoprotein SlyB
LRQVRRELLEMTTMRALAAMAVVALSLTGCSEQTISDQRAKELCTEWVQDARPGYEVTVREPMVVEKDRLVVIGGTATKGSESAEVQCAVDLREGEVIAGFK